MKKWYVLLAGVFSLMSLSCQNEIDPGSPNSTDIKIEASFQTNKISKDVEILSKEDAMSVAAIFADANLTRSGSRQVRNVVAINDETGNPLMYAVNFDEGYILVSATRKYFPVLAEVESGNFDTETTGTGADLFFSGYKAEITYAMEKDTSFVTTEWIPYVDYSSDKVAQTRMDDSYWDVLNEYWADWIDEDCNVYFLREKPEAMPEEMYNRYCTYASDFMGEDAEYMTYAVIVEKYIERINSKGPFCLTTWDQGYPYNTKLDNPQENLGCTTIAAGQIMKYFRMPTSFNWDEMPRDTTNYVSANFHVLTNFLKALHDAIGVHNGLASTDDVQEALHRTYGYDVTRISHSLTRVMSSLNDNRPVYMRGNSPGSEVGHAWVCDGYKYTTPEYEYRLFTVPPGQTPVTRLEEAYRETYYDTSHLILNHMNWGWGGRYDGYYYDPNLFQFTTDPILNFVRNRKDLLINY